MEIRYILTEEELAEIKFAVRPIVDRLYPAYTVNDLLEDGTWLTFGRKDMYWVECSFNGTSLGPVSIEPNLRNRTFDISQNHCKVNTHAFTSVARRVHQFFSAAPEHQTQLDNIAQINARVVSLFGSWEKYKELSRKRQKDWLTEKLDGINNHLTLFAEYVSIEDAVKQRKIRTTVTDSLRHLTRTSYAGVGFDHWLYLYKTHILGE